ncbi:hypothetical protein AWENTII_006442 [Aspergillus wentii]|nr:hypothetical protein MW887_003228 [Aspergillus wentii]
MARSLSLAQKAHLLFTFCFVVPPISIHNIIGAVIRAWLQRLSIRASIRNAFARSLMTHIRPRQLQAILPPTLEAYRSWLSSKGSQFGITHEAHMLDDKHTHLLWLGERYSRKVVLFFHGGGYVMPLSTGHLEWMAYFRKKAIDSGVDLTLVPDSPYPRQLAQATMALQHLLEIGYEPGDIVIAGDSAGGHLCLSLLSHLLHPRSDSSGASSHIHLDGRLRGCAVISPLLSLDLTTRSYRERCSADVLSRKTVRDWGRLLTDNSPWKEEIRQGKGWGMALDVPDKWWNGIENVVDQIMVTGGQEEIFRDHILQFIDVMQMNGVELSSYIAPDEAHDGPLMDFSAGRPPSMTTQAITDWLISSFVDEEIDNKFL